MYYSYKQGIYNGKILTLGFTSVVNQHFTVCSCYYQLGDGNNIKYAKEILEVVSEWTFKTFSKCEIIKNMFFIFFIC